MPRPSIENVGPPPKRYRVDRRTDDPSGIIKFEDLPSCQKEDARRIRDLERYLASKLGGRKMRRAARVLAPFLQNGLDNVPQRLSAASRVSMRDWRIRVSGWLWSLVARLDAADWRYFTVVLPGWWVPSRELMKVRAKRLTEKLRAALNRAGAAKTSGWVYAMIHGEYDATTKGFTLHFHGIATEGKIKVLDALRKQPQFRRNEIDGRRYPKIAVARKLQIDHPRGYCPDGITYTSKSIWLEHNSQVDAEGKRCRVGLKHRIADGKHLARCLCWLHEQRAKDQVLLIHLSVKGGKLVPRNRGVRGRGKRSKPVHK